MASKSPRPSPAVRVARPPRPCARPPLSWLLPEHERKLTMSQSRRPISEKLDQAIADVNAMVAGEIPINADLLRWIWIVDDAATKGLEIADQEGRLDENPVVHQLRELMGAVESGPAVKGAYLDAWARHATSGDPNAERHYLHLMTVLDDLMAKHPGARIVELIPACLEILRQV